MAIGFCFTLLIVATVVGGLTAGPRPARRLAEVPREWDGISILSIAIPAMGAFVVVSVLMSSWWTRLS